MYSGQSIDQHGHIVAVVVPCALVLADRILVDDLQTVIVDLYEMVEAPEISYEDMSYHFTGKNRKIRVYHDPNAELTLRDFFAKLKLNYGM